LHSSAAAPRPSLTQASRMFFIDAREKLKDGEAAGGDIEGVAEAKKGKNKKKAKK